MGRRIWFALIYLGVLVVAVAEENAADHQYYQKSNTDGGALNDLGTAEGSGPAVTPRAKRNPPSEVCHLLQSENQIDQSMQSPPGPQRESWSEEAAGSPCC